MLIKHASYGILPPLLCARQDLEQGLENFLCKGWEGSRQLRFCGSYGPEATIQPH